jgi:SOS-response transcriptional repressor LexA
LEKLEETPNEVVLIAPENLPEDSVSDFVAVGLVRLSALADLPASSRQFEGYILAYRQWIPHPKETVAVLLDDDAMYPILPAGSIVAIDRAVRDPQRLQGRLVAACVEGSAMVRWLDISGRHLIFRPNQPSREYPIVPVEPDQQSVPPILGQVVWSWSRFANS